MLSGALTLCIVYSLLLVSTSRSPWLVGCPASLRRLQLPCPASIALPQNLFQHVRDTLPSLFQLFVAVFSRYF